MMTLAVRLVASSAATLALALVVGCGESPSNPTSAAGQIDMSAAKAAAAKNYPDDPLSAGGGTGAANKAESGGERGSVPAKQ